MSIDKYLYISINKKFDGRIRLSYSRTENVNHPDELKHDLARACLKMYDLKGVEITSVSDIPGEGSGLGSSSSFTVGLLNAIAHYIGKPFCSLHALAETAYMIELGCGHPVGKQDFYAATYGGLHFFEFCKSGHVNVEPICFSDGDGEAFQNQLMLFWTGKTRKAGSILGRQSKNLSLVGQAQEAALQMRDLAYRLKENLIMGSIYSLGESLHENWELKKKLADGISCDQIDRAYAAARVYGASGGKLAGAGGGGFFLVCAEPCHQQGVGYILESEFDMREVPIRMSEEGSKVIYAG